MKNVYLIILGLASASSAFVPQQNRANVPVVLKMGYVPDGFTAEQWKAKQQKEKEAAKSKKFGAFGPQSFKSRSMQSFQKDLEAGKAGHLMPMFNAKEKLKKGLIKPEDIPYMQRGGGWDNSDVKGAKRKSWNKADQKYDQNMSPGGVDWTGRANRRGPTQVNRMNEGDVAPKKKFGLW